MHVSHILDQDSGARYYQVCVEGIFSRSRKSQSRFSEPTPTSSGTGAKEVETLVVVEADQGNAKDAACGLLPWPPSRAWNDCRNHPNAPGHGQNRSPLHALKDFLAMCQMKAARTAGGRPCRCQIMVAAVIARGKDDLSAGEFQHAR